MNIPQGRGAIAWQDPIGLPVTLHTWRPAGHRPDGEVVFVQHGMNRNGDEYRDFWIEAAERHDALIVAPTFSNEAFPQAETYNNGRVRAEDGSVRPRADWSYGVPARVFAALRAAGITTRDRARIFGHSAGSQFLHRLLAVMDGPWETPVCGNAGWYTQPDADRPFPEGLGGIGLTDADVARFLARDLTILAGDADTETSGPSLPSHDAALAQGPHRFARAHAYLAAGRAEAARRGVACNWRLVEVPGIGHDGHAMSVAAAALWFEGTLPAPETLAARKGAVVA